MRLPLTERLRLEHGLVLRLLASMRKSLALSTRRAAPRLETALELLALLLARHERLEERLLLPAFRAASPRAAEASRGRVSAHEEILPLLRSIRRGPRRGGFSTPAVRKLILRVRAHVIREEHALFPAIERALGARKLMELDAMARPSSKVVRPRPPRFKSYSSNCRKSSSSVTGAFSPA